jgi:hypothetical protein
MILCGVVVMILNRQDPNDYQRGRLVEHFRPGPMDPDQIWSSIRSGRGYTHRALGIAESFGTFIYWELGDMPRYDDLLHTCRGMIREEGSEVLIETPFGSEFVMDRVKINGVSCLVPARMTIQDAFAKDWILALRDGGQSTNPFGSGKNTLLDDEDFQIETASIERK